jgi:hypothetical protein
MGNCCTKFQDWFFPNPWSGLVINSMGADMSMRLHEKYGWQIVDMGLPQPQPQQPQPQQQQQQQLKPITPSLTAYREPTPSKETDPLLGVVVKTATIALPHPTPTPTPTHTAIMITATKPSPLLIGRSAVPPPASLSLLAIAKQKPIAIEH